MNGITLDLTVTAGTLLEICVLTGGGLFALSKFTTKFALLAQEFLGMKVDINDMKLDLKKVNELLARMAEYERRFSRVEEDVRELRHGRGWITPQGASEYTGL